MNFTKMHGAGNDFIVINQISQDYHLNKNTIQRLANRNFGIGFDQLLIIEKSLNPKAEFKYRIFNSDGAEVEQCGNGARCFYHFIRHYQLSENEIIIVETMSNLITLKQDLKGQVCVDMGLPEFIKNNSSNEYDYVSLGNPHAVLTVPKDAILEEYIKIGERIQNEWIKNGGINVGFMKVLDNKNIKLKVLERGSGLTLACGTGACAASAIAIKKKLVESPVTVHMDGGTLIINWDGVNSIMMSGPAKIVYEGKIDLNLII